MAQEAVEEAPDLETSSEAYARRFSGPVGEWFLEVQARATRRLLPSLSGGTALDVGGGHGQLVEPVLGAGYSLTIFGSHKEVPGRLADAVQAGRLRFASGDLLSLPFEKGAFDVVLAYRLLPHVPRWAELIAELCRVASRAVIVDYPTSRSVNALAGLLFSLKKDVESDTRPFQVFDDGDVRKAFGAAGYRQTGRLGEFVLPMALHRGLGRARLSRAAEGALGALGLARLFGSPVILRAERLA
jgi:SAM-dependent methyltransferase